MQNTIKLSAQSYSFPTHPEGVLYAAYRAFRNRLNLAAADRVFFNVDQYCQALNHKAEGSIVLHLRKDLYLTVRNNIWDAESLHEVFVAPRFLKNLRLRKQPTIVELGGYIGGFSIYAVKSLKAKKVVVYESNLENFEVLTQNVVNNSLDHRVVTIHQSAHSLSQILNQQEIDRIDLLKIDGSREPLDWLIQTPAESLHCIQNLMVTLPQDNVTKTTELLSHLRTAGYRVRTDAAIAYATLPEISAVLRLYPKG